MFHKKLDMRFKELPNVFGIVVVVLVKGYDKDGTDQYNTVLQIWKKDNLKLNKDKCNFRCTIILWANLY